ncbi:hypothetical protein V6N11_055339 [Hibiscus sabdariffa]|uniref:Ubiquitin-like domain-containing protein n=1 Tax=Hibiscus sabdariffa TaxID=183260 RepID=A0ABR2PEZ3_9ROSI
MILVAQGLKVGDDLSLSDSEGEIPQLDDEEKMIWQGIENDATKKNNEEMPSKESEELAMVNEVTCYYIRHVSLDLAGREIKEPKLSIEEPLTLELKPLMRLLKYAY